MCKHTSVFKIHKFGGMIGSLYSLICFYMHLQGCSPTFFTLASKRRFFDLERADLQLRILILILVCKLAQSPPPHLAYLFEVGKQH